MRVLYDGAVFRMQAAGGVNRYFANLIGKLPRNFRPSLLVDTPPGINFPSHPNLKVFEYGRRRFDRLSYRFSSGVSYFEDYYLDHLANFKRFDLVHPTYYNLLSGRKVSTYRCPVVITVWDMVHELFPETMDPFGTNAAEKRQAILAADSIICISENTRKDLLRFYPSIADRVQVTYLSSSIEKSMSYGSEVIPSRPYFIYVGNRWSYKNFERLLAAFARVAISRADAALCVVGEPFSKNEQKTFLELSIADRVEHLHYVGDNHLAKLYRCSLALIYPSLYEGFGIPPLEAMACGAPVVVARSSSLPEVVGEAGVFFDPYSIEELTAALFSMIDDASLRQGLIEQGFRRASEFSWDKTVAETIKVYRAVTGNQESTD